MPSNGNAYKRNIEESRELLQNIENILRSKGPGSVSVSRSNNIGNENKPTPSTKTNTSNSGENIRTNTKSNNISSALTPSISNSSNKKVTSNSNGLNKTKRKVIALNNTNMNISTSASKKIINKPNNETKISVAPTQAKKNNSSAAPAPKPAKVNIQPMEESVPEDKMPATVETLGPTTPVINPQPKPTLSKEKEEKSIFVPQRPRKRGGMRKTRKRCRK